MTPEQYERAGGIFHAALAVPVEHRSAFLVSACSGEDELRQEVESLLAAHDGAGLFIERPTMELAAALISAHGRTIEPPNRIGRYEIIAPIGRGGMGEVYRARDATLGRDIALKLPRSTSVADADAVRRFEREARAASSLNHPNIITVHEIGEADGRRFIAMELVEGQSLAELIGRPLDTSALVRIGRQLAQALAVAHEAGIVHGDIKPANIMLRSDGYVKVLDFGVARLVASSTQDRDSRRMSETATGVMFGTPRYMSPEQARGDASGSASDVFSCGVVLYELATGRHPFVAQSLPALLVALDSQAPMPPSRDGVRLPGALDRLLIRMLEKDPTVRASARDVEAALAALEAMPQGGWHGGEHNLPAPRTPFVGRRSEMATLESMLLDPVVRLMTLTGPGGTGKTRLALEIAARLADRFGGGVSFVALAPIAEARGVVAAVARALGVPEGGQHTLAAAIAEHLGARGRMLLVLDNFEHVAAAAPLIQDVLDSCPSLTVLVTSRLVLHLYGEQEFPLAPLPLPDADDPPERLVQSASVELFVQRATASRPDFALTPANGRAVAEICRRLDGLPLAIELAAARAKILPPEELLTRLDRRLELLTGGPRDLPRRQQTLRGAIAWSDDLLAPAEQTLFRRLSVFVGGCGLDAVEAVCNADEDLGIDALTGVTALVDNSLLAQRASDDGHPRFTMLETVREYARERLDESGETAATMRAHAAYALVLAEEGTQENGSAMSVSLVSVTTDSEAWLGSCEIEHDNLRAAIAYLVATGNSDWGLRLVNALFKFWEWREHLTEGREAIAAVLELPGAAAPTRIRARALYHAAVLADSQRDPRAATAGVREAHDIYAQLGDANGVAVTKNGLGNQAMLRHDYEEARTLFGECAVIWEQLGDLVARDQVLSNAASVAKAEGDYALARSLLEQVAAAAQKRGDIRTLAVARNALGNLAATFGDTGDARGWHQESLAHFRSVGDRVWIARVLEDLAKLEIAPGDSPERLLAEALWAFHEAGQQRGVARQLETLSWCAGRRSQYAATVGLASAAAAVRQRIRVPIGAVEQHRIEAALSDARRVLSPAEFDRAWAEGRTMSVDALIELAVR